MNSNPFLKTDPFPPIIPNKPSMERNWLWVFVDISCMVFLTTMCILIMITDAVDYSSL